MSFWFGDGFDCYAATADATLGYWDGGTTGNCQLVTGRFSGSRGLQVVTLSSTVTWLFKNGTNDALHHIVFAVQQLAAVSGTSNGLWFTFYDGSTAQCSVVLKSDGSMVLISGAATGSAIATYSGAITASSTWYAFEVEINISNTGGYMNVRKNGNTSNDFSSATNLNTRAGTANNYANRLGIGAASTSQTNHVVDDLLWRSDTASVPWVGDIRCYTRRPDTDAAAAWTRPGTFQMQPYFGTTSSTSIGAGTARYSRFVSQGGTLGNVVVSLLVGYTGNMKCTIFTSNAGVPGAVIQSATAAIANPVLGANTFTFSPAVSIAKGIEFFVGVDSDAAATNAYITAATAPYSNNGYSSTTPYASFPVANPSVSSSVNIGIFPVVTPAANADAVSEAYEDAAASYVYSSTVGQSDLYTLTGIDSTPTVIVGVTTRALAQKSDAGTRIITADLQSGATKVSSSPGVLNSGVWGWVYRTDLTDPATSAAWTAVGVNNARIGVTVTS